MIRKYENGILTVTIGNGTIYQWVISEAMRAESLESGYSIKEMKDKFGKPILTRKPIRLYKSIGANGKPRY